MTGTGITIRGFTITGGVHAVAVQDGASAEIDGNTIQYAGKNGIVVFRNSTAGITNNTIQNNPSGGINMSPLERSHRVYGSSRQQGQRPKHDSEQWWTGNPGIERILLTDLLERDPEQRQPWHPGGPQRSSRDRGLVISGNAGDGVRAMRNAGVDFGNDATGATPQFDDDINTGINGGFGVRCMVAGFVDGRLGALTGTLGGKSFSESCVDSVQP